ncbi:TetR/AcrR family transcriptional regulator, partial [Mangrovimicrobium sediminis]
MAGSNTARQRRDSRGEDARQAIMDAAETLIGEKGYAGVSLREITGAVGSANHSIVNYYFKNKDGLVRAIIRDRAEAIDARRKDLLATLVKRGFERDTRAILEAILRPIAEVRNAQGTCSYAAFLLALRVFNDISHWRTIADSPEMTRNLHELLRDSLAPLPADVVDMRFLAAFTVFLVSVVDWDQSRAFSQAVIADRDAYLQACLDFAAAGMGEA